MSKTYKLYRILLLVLVIAGIPSAKLSIFSKSRGLPPANCLSSDAESWVYNADKLERTNESQPFFENKYNLSYQAPFLILLQWIKNITGTSLPFASISVSWLVSVIFGIICFLIGKLFLEFKYALLFSSLCLFETHVLGGTVLGCSPFGLLPREVALILALAILYLKILLFLKNGKAIPKIYLNCIYGSTAILFYIYPPQGLVLFLTLFCFDLIIFKHKKLIETLKLPLLIFTCVLFPFTVMYIFGTNTTSYIDNAILRDRNSFMLITGFDKNTFLYLRRFLFQTSFLILFGIIISLYKPIWLYQEKNRILIKFLLVCFITSCFGLILEKNLNLITLFISRSSVFYALFFYLFILVNLQNIKRSSRKSKKITAATLLSLAFLLVNTNLLGFFKQCAIEKKLQKQTQEFFKIVEYFKLEKYKNSKFLVDYTASRDFAAMFRTYSGKSVFVCDKEGGISLVDGNAARNWQERTIMQNKILSSKKINQIQMEAKKAGIDVCIIKNENLVAKKGFSKSSLSLRFFEIISVK